MIATRILKDIERRIAEGRSEGRSEGKALGRSEGKALGLVRSIHLLVRSGRLKVDAGRQQVRELLKAKEISAQIAKDALAKLG